MCLLRGDGVEGDMECAVDGTCVVKKSADYLAETLYGFVGEGSGGVVFNGKLWRFSICGSCPGIRRVFFAGGSGMMEAGKCIGDIVGHGELDRARCGRIVPLE